MKPNHFSHLSHFDVIEIMMVISTLILFLTTTWIWIAYGYFGLATIPVVLGNWVSIVTLTSIITFNKTHG